MQEALMKNNASLIGERSKLRQDVIDLNKEKMTMLQDIMSLTEVKVELTEAREAEAERESLQLHSRFLRSFHSNLLRSALQIFRSLFK